MTVAFAVLLAKLGSIVPAVTVAVFSKEKPFARPGFTVAFRVIVALADNASDAKLMVLLFPEPPQTPLPVELHETNVMEPGRLSVTTTLPAASGPLLVRVTV